MNIEETKRAFRERCAVELNGTRHTCISALIYRKSGPDIVLQVELLDQNANSVTIAHHSRVHKCERIL